MRRRIDEIYQREISSDVNQYRVGKTTIPLNLARSKRRTQYIDIIKVLRFFFYKRPEYLKPDPISEDLHIIKYIYIYGIYE